MKRLRGFTLVEMLVVLAIIAILSGITFAIIVKVKGSSKQAVCASNLRQIGNALILYAGDHDDAILVEAHPSTVEIIKQSGSVYGLPYDDILLSAPVWPTELLKYGTTKDIFHCLLDVGWSPLQAGTMKPDYLGYGTSYINDQLGGLIHKTFTAIPNPTDTTMVMDGPTASHGTDGSANGMFVNCLSYDTHAKQTTRFNCVGKTTPYPGQPGT
ncbi:MAG: type II secretion system protein [Armatimonadota bacterium]